MTMVSEVVRRRGALEAGARERRAETRLFSGTKLARVLAKLGVDFLAFVAAYDRESSESKDDPLSDADRMAVQRFLTHRKISELAVELDCSIPTAHARVTRFVLDSRTSDVS
jgi:hypothetical protein